MDGNRDREQPGFCTRSGRLGLLRELADTDPDAREPAPVPERSAAARPGISRYFRWASRST
jgi:hypothetical protein